MKMKLQIPFQMLSLLMTVLMFNMPSVTLAQQNLVQAEAITTAEQDAINDVNKRLWFVAGLAALGVGGLVGCLTGCAVGSIIQPPPPSGLFYFKAVVLRTLARLLVLQLVFWSHSFGFVPMSQICLLIGLSGNRLSILTFTLMPTRKKPKVFGLKVP